MLWAIKQLSSPLRYLRITQGGGFFKSKKVYDIVFPVAMAAIGTAAMSYFSASLGLFADNGLVPGVLELLNLMIAFFIAALAAVATFDRPALDEQMKGEPAVLRLKTKRGIDVYYKLTNRQFICYLFGYLSFSSIVFIAVLYVIRQLGPAVLGTYEFDLGFLLFLKLSFAFLFFLVLWQIVVTMLLGIYFLCDRLQFIEDQEL